jgi:hypothetical protein
MSCCWQKLQLPALSPQAREASLRERLDEVAAAELRQAAALTGAFRQRAEQLGPELMVVAGQVAPEQVVQERETPAQRLGLLVACHGAGRLLAMPSAAPYLKPHKQTESLHL